MGVDGWHLAWEGTPPTLYLIQSKDTKLDVAEMEKLKGALPRLFHEKSAADANVELKARASELRERISEDLQVELHFVTSHIATQPVRNHADGMSDEPLRLFEREFPCKVFVHDIVDLAREIKLAHAAPISARFEVNAASQFKHATAGKYLTATAAVPALALVKLFDQHRTNLFRLNPRYYQSSRTVVNKEVLKTLLSNERTNFFLLNNGITAVCSGLRITESGTKAVLAIDDFQIVNGCQTTATLYEAWKKGAHDSQLAGVEVLVRVIEAPASIAPLIAQTTNSQNPIKPEDFKSNDERQERLHDQFEKLTPPWFYEHKRGVWTTEYPRKTDRLKFTDPLGFVRHLEMKDLAQACLAFLGRPADAIDRTRAVFTNPQLYSEVFPEKITAQRLLLPYLLFLRADAVTRKMKADGVVWAPYLRYPLASAVGRWIREVSGVSGTEYLSAPLSKTFADTLDLWAPTAFEIAANALKLEVEAPGNEGIGARTLVRQSEWVEKPYQQFKRDVAHHLSLEDSFARSKGQDPEEIGLRSAFPVPIRQ